jgi:biotin transport system permease protein
MRPATHRHLRESTKMGSLYSEHRTWLHAWPAGWKLLALAVLGTLLFWLQQPLALVLSCVASSLMLGSLGQALTLARKALRAMVVAALLVLAFHAAFGEPWLGVSSAARLLTATSLGIALTLTTRHTDLLQVMERLLQPLRLLGLRPDRLALQVALMLRFTEHFFVLWQRLDDAHRVRTGRAGGWRLLAPLTIHMLESARRVADTLHVRLGA